MGRRAWSVLFSSCHLALRRMDGRRLRGVTTALDAGWGWGGGMDGSLGLLPGEYGL